MPEFLAYGVHLPPATETITYDADGNTSSDGIWNYQWDAENRLVGMELQSSIGTVRLSQSQYWLRLEFAYDAMGRRISKRVYFSSQNPVVWRNENKGIFEWNGSSLTKFVYDLGGWNLLAAVRCDDTTGEMLGADQTFAWGPDLSGTENGAGGIGGLAIYLDDFIEGGGGSGAIGAMFPTYDGNGNVLRLFDGSANSAGIPNRMAAYTYGPFGEDRGRTGPVESSRFPFRWSTKYTDDETGLVYYGYRYYSPGMGRWINRDPKEERGGKNLFGFVRNSISKIDPLGLDGLDDAADFAAGVADSLSFGLTRQVRKGLNWFTYDSYDDENIDTEGGWYKAGEYTETAVEIAVTLGGASLRVAARKAERYALEGSRRTAFKRANKIEGGIIHHINPIKGHPNGTIARYPLPYKWSARGFWNMEHVADRGVHMQRHLRMQQLESGISEQWRNRAR